MDLEFKNNKLVINLTPEETSEFVASLPDEVLTTEVIRRGHELSGIAGWLALEGVSQEETADVGEPNHEYDETTIRRPMLKHEFLKYAEDRLESGEKNTVRAQKGVIGRAWGGLMRFVDTGDNDFYVKASNYLGVAPPAFEQPVTKVKYPGGKRKEYIDEDRTDGLDMDQTARYMIAISQKIRERHGSVPLDKVLAADVMQRCLESYSFVGCQILCDYLAETSLKEGGLPEDIDRYSLEQASRDFAELGRQTSKNVFLKQELFGPEDIISIDDFKSVHNSRGAGQMYWDLYRKVREGRILGLRLAEERDLESGEPPRIIGDIKEVVSWMLRNSHQGKATVIERIIQKREYEKFAKEPISKP